MDIMGYFRVAIHLLMPIGSDRKRVLWNAPHRVQFIYNIHLYSIYVKIGTTLNAKSMQRIERTGILIIYRKLCNVPRDQVLSLLTTLP